MSSAKDLLEKRTQIKKKKPRFIRKDANKKKRLSKAWRRPRGLHNKQRLKRRGVPPSPSSGYRAPKEVRGLHKTGLVPVIVSNIKQLDSMKKDAGVVLSSKIGDKKRHALLLEIKKRNLALLNLDADKTIARIETKMKQRKEEQEKKLKRKEEKRKGIEEKAKKKEEAKKKEPDLTDEEKKKLEKQEKDKLLTKKT